MSRAHVARGFTLLEVLVAVLVVGLVFGGLLSIGSSSTRALALVHARNERALLAEERLRGVLEETEQGRIPPVGLDEGRYEPPFETLVWELEVAEVAMPFPADVAPELRSSSSVFAEPAGLGRPPAGDQLPSVRRITVRVYDEEEGREDAIPFVAFAVDGVVLSSSAPLRTGDRPLEPEPEAPR